MRVESKMTPKIGCLLAFLLVAGCAAPPVSQLDTSKPAVDRGVSKTPTAPSPPRADPAPPADKSAVSTLTLSQQELAKGIASYEDGDYRSAARALQAAVNFGLPSAGERARAHKYLAFIHCVSKRERPCRDEFRLALGADPTFDLAPAESGHPSWGPVFRAVKSEPAKPSPK